MTRHNRKETERFKGFTYDELLKRDKVNLATCGVLIKHFKRFAEGITKRLKALAYKTAEEKGRPVQYLNRSEISKEALAREIACKDGIRSGLIALLTAVEPCWSYSVRGDRETKQIHLQLERRQ